MNQGTQAARGDINALKLMSAGLYDVTVTFEELPPSLERSLAAYRPMRVQTTLNTVVVTLKAQDGGPLGLVARLGELGRVRRLEVSGASLEDIFIELTARKKEI
jgi:hypothetical protein